MRLQLLLPARVTARGTLGLVDANALQRWDDAVTAATSESELVVQSGTHKDAAEHCAAISLVSGENISVVVHDILAEDVVAAVEGVRIVEQLAAA